MLQKHRRQGEDDKQLFSGPQMMHREKQKKTDDKNVEPASEHDHRLHISVEQPGGCKAERCRKIVKYSHIGQGIARA